MANGGIKSEEGKNEEWRLADIVRELLFFWYAADTYNVQSSPHLNNFFTMVEYQKWLLQYGLKLHNELKVNEEIHYTFF